MDDNKTNQSIDGMMGGEPNQLVTSASPSVDGFSAPTTNNTLAPKPNSDTTGDANRTNEHDSHEQHPANNTNGSGSNPKGLKLLLTLFIILFVVATAAAVYLYMNKDTKDVTVNQVDVTKLQQQNASLTYDNKSLKTQNEALQAQVTSITTTAQQLKTKCGTACKSTPIPQ